MGSNRFAGALSRAGLLSMALALGACASTGATKTVSTLAGSSAGAVAANAISVAGPWGYLVSIASSAIGGFAGDRVSRLFGGGKDEQTAALIKALDSGQPTAVEVWGAQDGKKDGGYAEATGPLFLSNAGANCRSFMQVKYRKSGGLGSLDPAALKQGVSAAGDIKASAEKLGDVNNVGDAVSGAENAASAVGKAQDTVAALTPVSASSQAPAQTASAPAAEPVAPRLPGTETFGTACKDTKDGWKIVKPAT